MMTSRRSTAVVVGEGRSIDRARLSAAFRALRSQGFIARQSFMCCGNCAGTAIANQVGKMIPEKQKAFKGAVFFHKQAQARMEEGKGLWINFGDVDANGKTFGLPTISVGTCAVVALRAAGLMAEWDGDPLIRILVSGTV